MTELVQTYRGAVMQWHCDHMGHMNVMWYTGKFDEANWNLFSMIGATGSYLRDSGRAVAAVEQRIQYRRELVPGDTVVIDSGILEMREKVFRFFHEMRHAESGDVAATSRVTGVHLDAATRKAAPFPPAIQDKAREFIRAYDFGDRT